MRRFAVPLLMIAGMAVLAAFGTVLVLLPDVASAQTAARAGLPADAWGWGLLSAALATAASCWPAAAVAARHRRRGRARREADLFGRLLIFVGLAEGIAIYGVIISILILNRLI
jgi:V/A-type H+-transporting ATPase subunit K